MNVVISLSSRQIVAEIGGLYDHRSMVKQLRLPVGREIDVMVLYSQYSES